MSPEVVSLVEELIYPDDIFYCNSQEEGVAAARVIIERGYPTVFTGGGDGTIVSLINDLWDCSRGTSRPLPKLGILSLGTGNAMARMVSSGSPIQDLKSYVANPSMDTVDLGMVESEGRLFPFGGLGVDAQILADYLSVKEGIGAGVLKPVFQTVGGYFFAFFGVTAPRHIANLLSGKNVVLRLTNMDAPSYRILDDGTPGPEFPAGELMYEGPFTMLMAGTCPFYGYGMKVLPFADVRQDAFNLRMVGCSTARLVSNLGTVWKGTYRNPDIMDFYCRAVRIELSDPSPYQRGGDLIGTSTMLEFRHIPGVVKLLRFI
jgi:diacylglycerol kinase family enzyme